MQLLNLLAGRQRLVFSKETPKASSYEHDYTVEGTFVVSKRQLVGRKGQRRKTQVGELNYRAYVKGGEIVLVETPEVRTITFTHPVTASLFLKSVQHRSVNPNWKLTPEARARRQRLRLAPSVISY